MLLLVAVVSFRPRKNTMSEVKTPAGYIDDGYSLPFVIPEVPGVSVGLSGTYRPMTQRELQKFFKSLNPASYELKQPGLSQKALASVEDQIDAKACEGVASHLIDWSLTDRNGNPVPITAANVSRIYPPSLQANLINVVCGMSGLSDVATRVTAVSMDASLDVPAKLVEIEKILKSDTPNEVSDEKN